MSNTVTKKETNSDTREDTAFNPTDERMKARETDGLWVLLRSLLVWGSTIIFTMVLGLFISLLSPFRMTDVFHRIAVLWGKVCGLVAGVRVEFEHPERIVRDEPVILVSNHLSLVDVLALYRLDTKFSWMAKHTLFKIPIFGWAMANAGYIPVVRDDRRRALKSMYAAAGRIRNGTSVIFFPEGTRNRTPGVNMLPFKAGGFILAKKSEVRVQPLTIWGTHHIMPYQEGRWIQRLYPGRVQIVVHEPLTAADYARLSTQQLSEKVRAIIAEPLPRLSANS